MLDILLLIITIILIYSAILFNKFIIQEKRGNLKSKILPHKWQLIIKNKVNLYGKLPLRLQSELQEHIKIFLAEKKFIGQENLVVTDEMKLVIASQACILLLGNNRPKSNYYPYLKYIHLYPHHIKIKTHKSEHNLLLGQSSVGYKSGKDGIVSLSWSQVEEESFSANQGQNVILHEFAHQLDQEFGSATGMPRLSSLADTITWGKIFAQEYQQLCQQVAQNQITIIDRYGATNPVEFFAVVTETFFVKSQLLATYHPLLYEQLRRYYGVDPVNWN